MNEKSKNILLWLVSVLVPVFLIMTAVRLLLLPAFVSFEYNLPNFPDDPYGFTKEQRLKLAPIALDYLLNDESVDFLGDLKFEDGTPVYNARELKHMEDVKILTQSGLVYWVVLGVAFVAIGLWFWRMGDLRRFLTAIAIGGKWTVWIILALIVIILLSFDFLFVGFHRIFFEGDTWLFRNDDTLIRLFPLRFWQDVFTYMGIIALVQGVLLWQGLKPKLKGR